MLAVSGGCLMCGVDSQLVHAVHVVQAGSAQQAARDAWAPMHCTAGSLGARSPLRISGHVCQPCGAALERVGSIGPSAMEHAVVSHLRPDLAGQLPYGVIELSGIVGWGALVVQAHHHGTAPPAPNERPWDHLAGMDRLSEQLTAALG